MKLEYSDLGYYICEYVTVVNGENYTLTFQATKPYTDSEYSEIKEIVDSVRFVIDQSMKKKNDSSWVEGMLDDYPASVCKWTELTNVRRYFEFFMSHREEFD